MESLTWRRPERADHARIIAVVDSWWGGRAKAAGRTRLAAVTSPINTTSLAFHKAVTLTSVRWCPTTTAPARIGCR